MSTYNALRAILEHQIDDYSLWFYSEHITEIYLQKALRNLHYAVEEHLKLCEHGDYEDD